MQYLLTASPSFSFANTLPPNYNASMKPRLIIQQKITPIVNKYFIYEPSADDTGALKALAQQKRIAFKEKVNFYSDQAKSNLTFTFRAEKVMDIHGRFFVEDVNGRKIGAFRKVFGKSLLMSTWRILDDSGNEIYEIRENNQTLAIFRRFGGEVPVVGFLVEILMLFLKYHFEVIDLKTGQEVGIYRKTKLIRDHYEMSLTDDAVNSVDWRTWAALGVALDALQSR